MTVMVDWSALLFKILEECYKKAYGYPCAFMLLYAKFLLTPYVKAFIINAEAGTIAAKKGWGSSGGWNKRRYSKEIRIMAKATRGRKLNKYVSNYVVFDLETTGTSPNKDEVVEISAVKVIGGKVEDEFSSLVNPGRQIPYSATAVNHITDAMVKDSPAFSVVLQNFLAFAGNMVLVGHNIHAFDMKFIYRDAERYYGIVIENDYIDTLSIARMCLRQLTHHRLTDLAAYYGISSVGAHRALNDCYINQQVYEKLGKEMEAASLKESGRRICPECGSNMVKRSGRYGEFYGCSSYPACRHTENAG